MEPVRNVSSNPSEGFEFEFDWAANSKKVQRGTSLQFKPPCLTACAPVPTSTVLAWAVPVQAHAACMTTATVLCLVAALWSHSSPLCPCICSPSFCVRTPCPAAVDVSSGQLPFLDLCALPARASLQDAWSIDRSITECVTYCDVIVPNLTLYDSLGHKVTSGSLLCRFTTGEDGVILYIYAVPTSANTTRTVINAASLMDRDAGKTRGFGALLKYLPR